MYCGCVCSCASGSCMRRAGKADMLVVLESSILSMSTEFRNAQCRVFERHGLRQWHCAWWMKGAGGETNVQWDKEICLGLWGKAAWIDCG